MFTHVTGRVDLIQMCVCPPDSKIKYSVFYSICVLMFMYYTVCYFYWYLLCSHKANFYVIHRQ